MNCAEIQQRLSAYYDGELPDGVATEIAAHLRDCPSCAEELASFGKLSDLSRRLDEPLAPAHLWSEIEAKLDAAASELPEVAPRRGLRLPSRFLAIAATIAIAAGIGVLGYQSWMMWSGHQMAATFATYLNEFHQRPDQAQQFLLTSYKGRSTTLQDAEATLGYEPLVAKSLPPGYSVKDVYLLHMPCCTCAQVVCENKEGQTIAIFEHDIDQPAWSGGRPVSKCRCEGVPTSVVQVGDRLAATWQQGKRYFTVVGAGDLDEVTEFVAHFKGANSSSI